VREFREGLQTSGGQHDEVRTGFGFITRFTGYAWPEQRRTMRSDAVVHQSVYRRFDLKAVQVYDVMIPYRPATLGTHKDFEAYYKQGAPFPADSLETGTEMAGEPPKTTPGQTLAAGTAQ
jgi:hypothetical protein